MIDPNSKYLLRKENIIFVLAGIVLMILGYLLMIGGGSDDPNVFQDDIYGFQRTVLAPILIIAGLVTQIFAILRKPGTRAQDGQEDLD